MSLTLEKTPRLDSVDALRGFAVLAILLLHSLEHFLYFVYPEASAQSGWLNFLDAATYTKLFALFAGKSYAIFALLFGLTFFIQSNNQQLQGRDFGYRFLWRLVLLAGFATINAIFFPGGDVLMLFAIMGILLFATRRWSSKAVLILAIICLAQPVEWVRTIQELVAGTGAGVQLCSPMYGEIQSYVAQGSFWDFVSGNAWFGQKVSFLWAWENGRTLQTAGLFLLGMLLGRHSTFIFSESSRKFWIYTLIVSAILYSPLLALSNMTILSDSSARIAFDMWQKLAFTGVLVSSFVLIYNNSAWFRRLASPLRTYGRMSLTNYLSQSCIGMLIFMPFGLNLAPVCGYFVSALIGLGIFGLQLAFSTYWLRNHKQGPLENIWHRLTWL